MQLAYEDTRSDPVVVLLHGFPLSRKMWVDQLAFLRPTHRVIAPDLRGHGDSPAPEGIYSMDQMADDVVGLLDGLGVTEPIVLGGLSMGGYVALSLVVRYPQRVRGLILLDTRAAADTPEAARTREETARTVLREGSAGSIIETMVPRLFGKTTLERHPEKIEPMLAVMERTSAQGVAGALRGMAIRPDRRSDLPKIPQPTLVLVGADDVISPPAEAREIAAALPEAKLEVIPAAGHLAPYENPAAANAAIRRFLERFDRSSPPRSRTNHA
jgi:pimeloyl-ACP methyl ester carboxylesterase